ncbi:uncharacterized protein L203_102187 [Cryptococcus depauperatus CBS 7841]|uniref:Uncharacterized protein n=1 Tax=Cryptococcus depauperatus CBS 7841 TaxID=1295531 RepID=A0A1E3IRS7_9TREE|nr:TatD DNase [Cryptococcus depauperatus CBS 7841]
MRFADIATNLTDPMFRGAYHGRQKHESDLQAVVQRARDKGVERILITGTSLEESKEALQLAKKFDLYCTAGIHPTSTSEMDKHPKGAAAYLQELVDHIDQDLGEGGSKRIVSIGEVGLDYDRLYHSPKEAQLQHLPSLLKLSQKYRLPLFLHSRTSKSHEDLVRVMKEVGWSTEWSGGVVHSFTGTLEEMEEWIGLGLFIGVNGCSLKTSENLDVVKQIPLDRLLLETDAPWCGPTSTHASSAHLPDPESSLMVQKVSKPEKWKEGLGVKGRMEPAEIGVIAHIVAHIKEVTVESLAEQVWSNTTRLFWPQEAKSKI